MILFDLINLKKIRRAIIYLAVILVTVGLQTLVFSRVSIFGVKAMFVPVLSIAIGMFEGGVWGGALGLVMGIVMDNATAGSSATFTVLLPAVGFLSGLLSQFYINKKLVPCLLMSLSALVVTALCQGLPLCLFGDSGFLSLWPVMGIQVAWSLPFAVPVFFICRSIAKEDRGRI